MLNIKPYHEKVIKTCQELIRIPSLSGDEQECANAIIDIMKTEGFDEVITTDYGSIIGRINGKKDGKTLLFDGHMDTVDLVDYKAWNHDPFGAEIVDNKIYGRGSTDMKGSLTAMIMAAIYFARNNNRNFNGDIYIACSVQEEHFEGISSREISDYTKPDFVIIGEPSSLNIARGQLGRGEIKIETNGISAHSSNPQDGMNAVYGMMEVINIITNAKLKTHNILGEGIIELTDIISEPYPGESIVPNLCRATFDRRILVGETKESVLEHINKIIKVLNKESSGINSKAYYTQEEASFWTGGKVLIDKFFPAWLFNEDHELVQKVLKGLKKINLNSTISHYSFCTNGSHYAGEKGIPTIGFGPSHKELTHIIDEYIEIDQLIQGFNGFYGIMDAIVGRNYN